MNEQEEKLPEEEVTPEEATAQTAEAPAESAETDKKSGKKDKKKDKGFTFTREQVEQMELAVRQLEASKEQYTRLAAEYDNFRKRTAREKTTLYEDGKLEAIKGFLPVYDNLERAVSAPGDEESVHKKGLEMIFQQYKDILAGLGVTEIPALGLPFDPERHNAVMHIDDEALGENVVAAVFQSGFALGERVIRFATVQVAN